MLGLGAAVNGISEFAEGDRAHMAEGLASIITVPIVIAPAALLLTTKRVWAAIGVLLITALPEILSICAWLYMLKSDPDIAGGFIIVVLFWIALTMQAWRAVQAVRALPQLRQAEVFS